MHRRRTCTSSMCILAGLVVCSMYLVTGWAQGIDTALLRGAVQDPSGAVIHGAALRLNTVSVARLK
jgi:hypothetical protein